MTRRYATLIALSLASFGCGIREGEMRYAQSGQRVPLTWTLPVATESPEDEQLRNRISYDAMYVWEFDTGDARFCYRFWPTGQVALLFDATGHGGRLPAATWNDREDLKRAVPGQWVVSNGRIEMQFLVRNDSGNWVLNPRSATIAANGDLREVRDPWFVSEQARYTDLQKVSLGPMAGIPDW